MTNDDSFNKKAREVEIRVADKIAIAGTLTAADQANGLATRVVSATKWLFEIGLINQLPVGYFGASTGAAAALVAAAELGESISAVVSRGGRPDLAGDKLSKVTAPTLLIVGGNDYPYIPQTGTSNCLQ